MLRAVAFDKDGHEAVGMVAMSALSQPSIEGIKRLMHGADAADVAGWAHALEDQHPDLARPVAR